MPRIPMLDGYKDMGATTAIGKVEQGLVKPGMKCIIVPTNVKCTIASVFIQEELSLQSEQPLPRPDFQVPPLRFAAG
eukprot:679530-Amphidinium_carterae.2